MPSQISVQCVSSRTGSYPRAMFCFLLLDSVTRATKAASPGRQTRLRAEGVVIWAASTVRWRPINHLAQLPEFSADRRHARLPALSLASYVIQRRRATCYQTTRRGALHRLLDHIDRSRAWLS